MKLLIPFTIVLTALGFASISNARDTAFFDSDEAISIRLEAPIASLKKQRGKEPDWLEGKVIYRDAEGVETALSVKIKARGIFRRMRRNCSFPPYWINFKKSEVKGTPFDGIDKVKVVAHCKEGWSSLEPYMYTEYLAYKTYNILTDKSFGVRLMNIQYYDTDKEKELKGFGAFFIEHVDSFEDRFNAKQVKDRFILPSRYNQRDLCRAEMFQFFLGNADFSFFASEDECCHNGKAFSLKDESSGMIPVPYDFDMTGLVNPPYAEPDPNLPVYSIKDRHYRGIEVEREILEDTVNQYLREKKAIYQLWEETDILNDKYKLRALDYIDDFYKIIKNGKKFRIMVIGNLRHAGKLEEMIQESIDKENRKR